MRAPAPSLLVKIGGSVLQNRRTTQGVLAEVLSAKRSGVSVLLLPGGGLFADQVRILDREFSFAPETAHRLAISAMDLNGVMITQLDNQFRLVKTLEQIDNYAAEGLVPVLCCAAWFEQLNALPACWEVTSDSLAVALAGLLGCSQVILVKMRSELLGNADNATGSLCLSAQALAEGDSALLDAYFHKILADTGLLAAVCSAHACHGLRAALRGEDGPYLRLFADAEHGDNC